MYWETVVAAPLLSSVVRCRQRRVGDGGVVHTLFSALALFSTHKYTIHRHNRNTYARIFMLESGFGCLNALVCVCVCMWSDAMRYVIRHAGCTKEVTHKGTFKREVRIKETKNKNSLNKMSSNTEAFTGTGSTILTDWLYIQYTYKGWKNYFMWYTQVFLLVCVCVWERAQRMRIVLWLFIFLGYLTTYW